MENKRKIAIFTDAHGLLEPLEAAIEDIKRRGITEVYSLGDNIGYGPNPSEVIDLLEENNVISIAGNSEEYVTLGTAPFIYLDNLRIRENLWTTSKLNEHQKGIISLYPHSIELALGGKKIALCHFANDVRIDYGHNSTWSYQHNLDEHKTGYKQFLYTNSKEQLKQVAETLKNALNNDPYYNGYKSAQKEPLFNGNTIEKYDAIIQGHVHWKYYEKSPSTEFYSIRAVGMAYKKDPIDTASYVILTETDNGFSFEEILVRYDREKMVASILNCNNPCDLIKKYTSLTPREKLGR